jgi:CheY-like chemotaxis protein/two-component sensor histidine kinase
MGVSVGGVHHLTDNASTMRAPSKPPRAVLRPVETERAPSWLAIFAHELRLPLAPLRHSLELLGQRPDDREVVAQVRATMDRQVRHLTRLVDELLDVTRLARGAMEVSTGTVSIADVVAGAIETARPLIDARRHTLATDLPSARIFVAGDLTRLTQVVTNLLINAAKYTEPGGRIALGLSTDGDEVTIRVRDTGMGIAPEMLSRIFDLFVQVDTSAERTQGGLGIGLALARYIVEAHGGRLTATSEGIGHGSELVVRLPVVGAPPSEALPPSDTPLGTSPVRYRILVVDDYVDSAESVAQLLRTLGHVVQVAHDGMSALTRAIEMAPDVVLLDIGLPRMDGYAVARRMRGIPGLRQAVLVAVTGYGGDEDRLLAREAGFDYHLVKPAGLDTLQQLLASLSKS